MPDVAEELNRIVSEGLDATLPSLDRLQRLERRRRRRRIVPGTVAALVSVIAIVAVVASSGGPPRRIPGRVTSSTYAHPVNALPPYVPTASLPSSFVIVRDVNSASVSELQLVETSGHVIRTLFAGPGLLYAQNTNGLFQSKDRRFVYFLDLKQPSPPGPGIGVYRLPTTGGSPKLVAYGTDPTLSPDGSILAYTTTGEPTSTAKSGAVIAFVDLTSGRRSRASLASIFPGAGIGNDVVLHLAWLPARHRLAVLLGPPPVPGKGKCTSVFDLPPGARCPRVKSKPVPLARSRLAIINLPASPSAPFTGRLVWAPADYSWNLMATGLADDTLLMVGTHGSTSAAAAESVFEIDPLLSDAPTRLVGHMAAGCYPLSLDTSSGGVLCAPDGSPDGATLGLVRLTSSAPGYSPMPFREVVTAGW
jgi:hypothetical protein